MIIVVVNNDSDVNFCDINRKLLKFLVLMYIVNIREGNYMKEY